MFGIIDLIYPKICISCGKNTVDNHICEDCFCAIDFIEKYDVCTVCGNPFGSEREDKYPKKHFCGKCLNNRYSFFMCRSAARYSGVLRNILHEFKYNGKLRFGDFLGQLAVEYFPADIGDFDLIVPVPVHIIKLRKREYNQSAIISSYMAQYFGIQNDPFILKKDVDTVAQVEFSGESERRRNVKGVFSVESSLRIEGRTILLFDDVFTTGATTNECSDVLIRAGAAKVYVYTLMRATF